MNIIIYHSIMQYCDELYLYIISYIIIIRFVIEYDYKSIFQYTQYITKFYSHDNPKNIQYLQNIFYSWNFKSLNRSFNS